MTAGKDIEGGRGRGAEKNAAAEPLIPRSASTSRNGEESVGVVLLSTAIAVCGSFVFGSCIGYSSPTQAGIMDDLNLSLSQYAVFGSILNIGAMVGAVSSGHVADFFGRKGAMQISSYISLIGWLAIYLAQGSLSLYFGRLLIGWGIGIFSYSVPVFIAEISPKHLRGGLTTANQLFICAGVSTSLIVGTFITWRVLALTGMIPCLILLVGLLFIPESPRWLAKVGKKKEFEIALRHLRGKDANISEEAEDIEQYVETLKSLPKGRIQDILQRAYVRPVIVGVGLMVFQQFGGVNGISFYASETFVAAGFSSGKLGNILVGCIQVPITFLGAILMDWSGRRPLLMVSASGTFVGSFLAGTSFFLQEQGIYTELVPILALFGILVFVGSFSIGMGAIPWVMMAEIFPINIKGIGGSLVTLVNWSGSWVVSYYFNFLMDWSSSGTEYKISETRGAKAKTPIHGAYKYQDHLDPPHFLPYSPSPPEELIVSSSATTMTTSTSTTTATAGSGPDPTSWAQIRIFLHPDAPANRPAAIKTALRPRRRLSASSTSTTATLKVRDP